MRHKSRISGSKILLTGGTGFLGQHLRDELADTTADVTLLVRPGSSVTTSSNETVLQGDVASGDGLDELGVFDVIVHLAAQTSVGASVNVPRQTWDVNATGTRNILDACRDDEVIFLLASTASVYGRPQSLPIDESHPMNVREPYGASKAAADLLASAYDATYEVDIITARFFNVFGPGQQSHNVIPTIVSQALEGGPIELGNLSPSRDFTYVADAIRAMFTLLESGETGSAYNVGRGEDVSIRKVVETVTELMNYDGRVQSVTEKQRDDAIEIPRHVADTTRLTSLGWEPKYSVREGLKKTIQSEQRK